MIPLTDVNAGYQALIATIDDHVQLLTHQNSLLDLLEYFESTWLYGTWPPESWCVFKETIRTKNALEGTVKFPL